MLIQDAAKRISVARKALVGAREAFRLAEARYQTQVGTSVDVLNAQASLTQTEFDLHQSLADYLMSIAKLHNEIGSKKIDFPIPIPLPEGDHLPERQGWHDPHGNPGQPGQPGHLQE